MKKIKLDKKNLIKDYHSMVYRRVCKKYNICFSTLYKILRINNVTLRGHFHTPYIQRNYINKQILYGSLLGDGHINRTKRNFIEDHCSAQKEYLQWKSRYLKMRMYFTRRGEDKIKRYLVYYIYSAKNDPWCIELRKEFYPNGIKVVTREILDKLDSLALLVWYLDDGNLQETRKRIVLATHCFTHTEHLIMQKWFRDKWEIGVRIYKVNDNYYLSFPVKSTKKLFDILKPIFVKYELPKCMAYKLWKK